MSVRTPRGLRHALAACLALAAAPAAAEVFINEVHYDDATAAGDTGERVEIVATAGESLSGWRVYLYNGTSSPTAASSYDNDPVPAGSLVSCGAQVRIAVVAYPSNGIQNGANDAIALVNPAGQVVQFLAWEGGVRGGSGPAAGVNATVLPVSETNATAAGTSLQLGGTAAGAAGFSWNASATQTFGTCNRGQVFAAPNPPPTVTQTVPANGATGVAPASALEVAFSEPVTAASGAFTLQCSLSGAVALSHPASATRFTLAPASVLRGGETCRLGVVASRITDAGGARPLADAFADFSVASAATGYWSRVNTSSASQLRCSIHATIRGHTVYPYSSSTGTNTWTILELADEDPANPGRILDAYRNRSYAKVTERAGSGTGLRYNREHTWPNSLGFGSATGNLGLPHAPYTDAHMLYLTDAQWNADRGNKPFAACDSGCGERVTEANAGAGGGSGVFPGQSNWVRSPDGNAGSFQVWARRRGDIARAVLYMAVRYEGGTHPGTGQSEPDLELTDDRSRIVITSSSPAYMGLLSTLLAWHQADPPDALERARHEVVAQFQGNRNPFVDHPEWASNALFTSTRPASCQLAN